MAQYPILLIGGSGVVGRHTARNLRGVPAGLYFPYQLLDPAVYFSRLEQFGGTILKLQMP